MGTIRINAHMRELVRKELLRKVYVPKLDALFERCEALHAAMHARVYNQGLIEKAEAFFAECRAAGFDRKMNFDTIEVRINGQHRNFGYLSAPKAAQKWGLITYSEMWSSRMTKLPDPCGGMFACMDDDPLGEVFLQLDRESEALAKEICEKAPALEATLDKFKSLKQVAEHWPEVLPVFEKYAGVRHEPENALVAMSFGELNDFYKLPPEPVEELAEAA